MPSRPFAPRFVSVLAFAVLAAFFAPAVPLANALRDAKLPEPFSGNSANAVDSVLYRSVVTNNNLIVGSSFEPTVRMHIAANGYVGIGTDAPQTRLHVVAGSTGDGVRGISTNGDGLRGDSTSFAGVSGYSTNGSGVYGSSTNHFAGFFQGNVHVTGTMTQGSDARLKQNISKLGYGLSEVLRLRPVSWRWKEHPESGQQLGLRVQDVEPVLPELVSTSNDAEQMKGLNYIGLVPILVNAIKEQQEQIEIQGKLVKQQQKQLADLKTFVCRQQKKAARCT